MTDFSTDLKHHEQMNKNKDIEDAIRLYKQQKLWKQMTTKELADYLIPCIALNQYNLFRDTNTNVAYAFVNWAFLNDETEERFKTTGLLEKFDWNNGKNIWHIDTINTGDGKINDIYKWVCINFLKTFKEEEMINWIRVNKDGTKIKRINKMKIKDGVKKFSNE